MVQRIRKMEARVCTSIIVAAELRYGARKKGFEATLDTLGTVLSALEVLPFGPPADALYASLRARLERAAAPIGDNGLLIAAHALALGCTIVTDNEREFARVRDLACENWPH